VESIGRGVLMRSLSAYYGRKVLVMRHEDYTAAMRAAVRAEWIADEPGSWYDYYCVVRFTIPRLVWYKLTGQRRAFGYYRNGTFICSELRDSIFDGIVSAQFGPPLPGDFANLDCFLRTWWGTLHFETVGQPSPEAVKLLGEIRERAHMELCKEL